MLPQPGLGTFCQGLPRTLRTSRLLGGAPKTGSEIRRTWRRKIAEQLPSRGCTWKGYHHVVPAGHQRHSGRRSIDGLRKLRLDSLFGLPKGPRRRCDGRRSHEGLVPLQRPLPGDHAMTRKQRTRAQIRKRQGTQSTTSESGADQRRRHRAGGANGRPPGAATTCPLS